MAPRRQYEDYKGDVWFEIILFETISAPILSPRNKKSLDEHYEEWDMVKYFGWTRLKEYVPVHLFLNCVVASWARQKNASNVNVVIPTKQILFAKDNLERCKRGEKIPGGGDSKDGEGVQTL